MLKVTIRGVPRSSIAYQIREHKRLIALVAIIILFTSLGLFACLNLVDDSLTVHNEFSNDYSRRHLLVSHGDECKSYISFFKSCKSNAFNPLEESEFECRNNKCLRGAGTVNYGAKCFDDSECHTKDTPPKHCKNQKCVNLPGTIIHGRTCRDDSECSTGWCSGGICLHKPHTAGRHGACFRDHECDQEWYCFNSINGQSGTCKPRG